MLAVISYRPSVIRSILRLYGVHSELPRFLLAYCAFKFKGRRFLLAFHVSSTLHSSHYCHVPTESVSRGRILNCRYYRLLSLLSC
jgi:hypothetical protein